MTTRTKQEIAAGCLVVIGFCAGYLTANHPVALTITRPLPNVTTIEVPVAVITEKVVKQVIEDPRTRQQVNELLAQNAQLQAKVLALSVTEAHAESHGNGPVVTEPAPTTPAVVQYHFKDWRLDFVTDTKSASYTLSQRFEILHTTGRLPTGKPLSLVSVSEIGENQERTPLTVETVALFTDQTRMRWQLNASIQAGVVSAIGLNRKVVTSGIAGVQWLSRGRSKAAEDKVVSLLSPVVTFGKVMEVGLLPVSYNLGSIPHNPLKDVWVSPYVGANVMQQRVSRVGLTFTSSF